MAHVRALLVPLSVMFAMAIDAQPGHRRALLVGINDYSASRFGAPRNPAPDRDWADLNGAVNDAEGMREMLIALYGFEERDVVVLANQDATRAAILDALQRHLVKPAAKGDVLLFYYAGHGSRVRNSLSEEADRMDESLVPADGRAGAPDIRDKELRPLFNAMLDKGARLTVILDNCYSGSGARGLPTGARSRSIKADPRDVADRLRPGPRPEDRGALVLSATQDFDRADETRDEQRRFHGVFSLALLRAMRDASPGESASETFLRARARMRGDTPFQEPVMAGNEDARRTPLFGSRRDVRTARAVVAVEKVKSDGTVVLQGGWANGLCVGSELRVLADRARLRVTALIGLGRSEARIDPGGTLPPAVKPGAMLEVVGWAAPPGRPLRVWTPRVLSDANAIAALARRLHAEARRRGIRWISDPIEETATQLLRRGNNGWELVGANKTIASSDPVAALATLGPGSSLFVQFPAPASMLDGIDGIESTDRPEDADYVLVGRFARHLEYAWVRPGVTAADRRKSSLPLRTDWTVADKNSLREAALRLRRIHAWNGLESPPGERSPYRLALHRAGTGELATGPLIGRERYELVLQATQSRARPRYLYVFVIDSHGRSVLLYPRSGSVENRLPLAHPPPAEIPLGRDGSFEVAPPYGIDTCFLLSTDEALPNPWILEWNGVRTRAPAKPSPLEQLLMSGSRTGLTVTPAAWSIERAVFESVPPR